MFDGVVNSLAILRELLLGGNEIGKLALRHLPNGRRSTINLCFFECRYGRRRLLLFHAESVS